MKSLFSILFIITLGTVQLAYADAFKGTWKGQINCSNYNSAFSATLNGEKISISAGSNLFSGTARLSDNSRKIFINATGSDGRQLRETLRVSKDFKTINGFTSEGCIISIKNNNVVSVDAQTPSAKTNSVSQVTKIDPPKPVQKKALVQTYAQRCDTSKEQIKIVQQYLKELDLYPYKIDGIAGKGTLAAIKKAKKLLSDQASAGDCITDDDIDGFDRLANRTRCNLENLSQCSDEAICERATTLRDGIRSWDLENVGYLNRAKDLDLDCNITVDNTPLTRDEAIYFLTNLIEFVEKNPEEFDLKFAAEFNTVRGVIDGEWSKELSRNLEKFRLYVAKFPTFQTHLIAIQIRDQEAKQQRIIELSQVARENILVLKTWAQKNVLDPKAAEIALLDERLNEKENQSENALQLIIDETNNLMSATGIKAITPKADVIAQLNNLFEPSSVYIFVNSSGDAANIYKNLEGDFVFERNLLSYCASPKLDAFDFYILSMKIFSQFDDVETKVQKCSRSSDIFIVKGSELISETVLDLIELDKLELLKELKKAERDKSYDQLSYLSENIRQDVIEGVRVGFGLLASDTEVTEVCAVFDVDEFAHKKLFKDNSDLLSALGYPASEFTVITPSAEVAFKNLQREQCGLIYGSSLTLGRIFLAADSADLSMNFLPIWISNATIEAEQKSFEEKKTSQLQEAASARRAIAEQNLLDEQARLSAADTAAAKQKVLRELNGLRFMVLKDSIQDALFAAAKFGFENSAEEMGYVKKYLSQPFVDQTTRYSPYDSIIVDMQKLAAERWEITEMRINQVDFGEATFNGRIVDAIEVEFVVASKNRLVGKYAEYCRKVLVLKDEDFEMWRNFNVMNCEDSTKTSNWKSENGFTSKWIVLPKN